MNKAHFTKADVGCWIDGAYGQEHACDKLRSMLQKCDDLEGKSKTIYRELGRLNEGFISEIMDEATDILQSHTADDLVWVWETGDLILIDEPEMD